MKTTEPNLNLLRGVPASGREVESFAPSPVKADDSPPPAGVVTSLYVHVPFCAHKCEYCAFYSHLPGGDGVDRYVAALTEEMRMVADGTRLKTVFFGGGTPSILNLRQWEKVFHTMDKVGWLGADEWTVECNPATVSLDKAKLLREFGVNRISMGVQSLDEALLDRLGRIHSREMVFKSYDILRKAGFENINIDLMFAIPGQTMPIWEATMNEAMAMQTEHLSCYEVIYEEDTPLFAQLQAGEIDVDEELACEMYERLVARAQEGGYERYEVANFAKGSGSGEVPSRACRHNVNYWRGGFYWALGPSAAGFEPRVGEEWGVRTRNWSNTTMYCEQIEKGQRALEPVESLSQVRRAGEIAAFGLRMPFGWSFASFKALTGLDLQEGWEEEMKSLQDRGWGILARDHFRLTSEGLRFADSAGADFLR